MKKVRDFVACLWAVLMRSFFIILIIAAGHFAFVTNDQGQDLILALSEKGNWGNNILFLFPAVILWSVTCWYSTRILFQLKDLSFVYKKVKPSLPESTDVIYLIIDPERRAMMEAFVKWTPRILGTIPFAIFISAFRNQAEFINLANPAFLNWAYTVITAGAIAMILFYSYRRRITEILKLSIHFPPDRFTPEPQPKDRVLIGKSFKRFIIIMSFLFLVFLIIFGFPMGSSVASFFGAGTIVIISLSMFTSVLAILSYWNNWKRAPVFVGLLAWMIFCGQFNDNTFLREEMVAEKKRATIEDHFHKWVEYHQPQDSAQLAIPLVIIAAEGGGIRALNWTASVLQRLEEHIPGFTQYIFAISGVSGGGVGSAFYLSYYRDRLIHNGGNNNNLSDSLLTALISADYLSSVTAGVLFPDNLQRILPIRWNGLNRTRRLEDAWHEKYYSVTNLGTWDSTYLSLWKLHDSLRYRMPALFLNGTLAETGQKAIVSNLAWQKSSDDTLHHFRDIIDVEQELGSTRDLPFKTATSLCARFPGLTTGGLLVDSSGLKVGHIVDGGYAENTGLETAVAVYTTLYRLIKSNNDTARVDIKPYVLFIKNSKADDAGKLIDGIVDVNVPFNAFFKAWDRGSIPTSQTVHDLINRANSQDTLISCSNEGSKELGEKYYKIELNRKRKIHLPLGWYLSEQARKELETQAEFLENEMQYSSYQTFVDEVEGCLRPGKLKEVE
jgi:hypothetical protein